MRVDFSIVTIPLFRIDVPASSKRVGFCSEFSGTEADDHVELRQELRPAGLSAGEHSDRGEILQVFMVCHHIDRRSRAFEVMSPDSECFKNGQEFFVMGVVVQFGDAQGSGMECNGMNMSVWRNSGKDCGYSVVGGVRFDNDRSARDEMGQDGSGGEHFL
jgi:hypothetical protein